jgi:pimeloyl-ACP methyl ester carboxylesterase
MEFLVLDAAVSAIKARYAIKHLVLVGHSGGATAIGAMLTLGRDDVVCAVMTSGAFSLLDRQARRNAAGRQETSAGKKYAPLDHVSGIRSSSNRRIIVAGDPRDSNTPFDLQMLFAEKVRSAGHALEVVQLKGVPPVYHDVGTQGLRLAAECAQERARRLK